jgi:alcohol dehydrogenase class IV
MARIGYLTTIDFGPGELASLPAALDELGVARPLLVSDRGLAASGLLDRCRQHLQPAAEYLDTPPNPTEEAVAAAPRHLPGGGVRRHRRDRRGLAHRPRQGGGAARDA